MGNDSGQLVLSVDLGTSTICAMAVSTEDWTPLATRTIPNDTTVPGPADVRHEQDPHGIVDRAIRVLAEVVADAAVKPTDIAAIGITGQMHGVLLARPDGTPLTNLITWRDRRVTDEREPGNLAEAHAAIPPDIVHTTGCALHAGYGGATLHWLARHEGIPPDAYALTIADHLAQALCGTIATDPSHAASWGLLDIGRRAWHDELIGALGIPRPILPQIRDAGTPLEPVLPTVATQLGIPDTVHVCVPLGDNQAGILGVAGFSSETAVLNLGTGGQISVPCATFTNNPPLETRPMPGGSYILVGASLCAGWSYAYLQEFYRNVLSQIGGITMNPDKIYEQMNATAAASEPGAAGLVLDSRFAGERGAPALRGALTDIDCVNLTPAHLTRAFLEGMVRELATLAEYANLGGITRIAAGGNAVRKNPLVKRIIEDAFGMPCIVGAAREDAALGAAYCAAVGTGLATRETIPMLTG